MEISQELILSLAGIVTAVGGAWLTVRKIQKDKEQQKEAFKASILAEAEESLKLKETALQAKIEAAEGRLDNLKESVEKDLAHLRETYNGEIKNLAVKIEDLRSDLRNQHTQMVSLLTKMIENSKE